MESNLDIRRNDPTALPEFVRLNLMWIEALHHIEPLDQYMADHPESYIKNGNSVFSLHIDDQVAGVCALKQDEDGKWELTKMAVNPDFRGRGLGKALIDSVEAYAKTKMGLNWIYLMSNTANAAAIRLYKRSGWRVTFEGPHPKYARANIGMEKDL